MFIAYKALVETKLTKRIQECQLKIILWIIYLSVIFSVWYSSYGKSVTRNDNILSTNRKLNCIENLTIVFDILDISSQAII
jgi:hypothetical protein